MRVALLVCLAALIGAPAPAAAAGPPPRWQTVPLPPEMPTPAASGHVATSDGAKIHFARFGRAGAPAVVFLHGGMGNADHWAHQIRALADTPLDIIAIDSRGQGRSTRTKTKPTYALMARDVLTVLDHLGVTRASFVGWSDGGEIALKLAIHHAARVDKLVILGSNYDAKGFKKRGGTSATFAAYGKKCRADYARLSSTPKQYAAASRWLSPIWREPMGFTKDQLRAIQAPTIVAAGEHDEIIELAQVKEMATLIPNARLEIFADASHFVLWQDPAALSKVLVDFVRPPSK